MAKYYSDLIELSPGYESVVDASIETRDREFWTRYIVNDDMVQAVDTIAKSLRREDPESIRHFWLSGTYGTGKTYSSIVIKHLLSDETTRVESFLQGNPLFADVRDRFLSIRKKAPYLVIWKSGESHRLNSSDKFLMELEGTILRALKENGITKTGSGALVGAVQKLFRNFKLTLSNKYDEAAYNVELAEYDSFQDFYDQVQEGNIDACDIATEILRKEHITLAADKETFKAWIQEIFEANPNLKQSGIFIIWDEFTEYIKNGYDIELLQELSQFAKTVPFYILYVIHEYPSMVTGFDPANWAKINARFHKINISLSDKTTFRLIGETLKVRPGMEVAWKDCVKELTASIQGQIYDFLPDAESSQKDLEMMYPIHPITVALISKTAGNFAAANRSIFRFMKDEESESLSAGFRYYIRNYGPGTWKWVTPDFLWDYFFVAQTHDSQNRENTPQAEECLNYYAKTASKINDERGLRIFKCCMLLRATIGTPRQLRRSVSSQGLKATRSTLIKCFYGQIKPEIIDEILNSFSELNILSVTDDRGDKRFDIPYAVGNDEFKIEFDRQAKVFSYTTLLKSDGPFGKKLVEQFLPDTKAVVKRLELCPCFASQTAINSQLPGLLDRIGKNLHKFGVMLLVSSTEEELEKAGALSEKIFAEGNEEEKKRLIVIVPKTLLPEDDRKQFLTHMTQYTLARKSGNTVSAKSDENNAEAIVGTWVARVGAKEMLVYHGSGIPPTKAFNNSAFIASAEKIIFTMFPYAPETICNTKTLYKSANINASRFGLLHVSQETIDQANPAHKGYSTQYQNIVDILKASSIWPFTVFKELLEHESDYSKPGRSVLELCKFINEQLTNNTSVDLNDLWGQLQTQFGYYNNMVCAYLLGFAFRFYVEAPYSWWDGTNPHPFSVETIPAMIEAICSGKVLGQRISIGSKTEKRFRDQTRQIFGLTEQESGNEDQCRKNLHIKITRCGYPIWTLQFLSDDAYNNRKDDIIKLCNSYQSFSNNIGDQKILMEQVVESFKGPSGKEVQKWLQNAFADRDLLNSGMMNFITQKSPETAQACSTYGFTIGEMFAMLRQDLQEEVWQWHIEDVASRLSLLGLDLKLVGLVNAAQKTQAKTVEKVRDNLTIALRNIKVPACIFEKEKVAWYPTLLDAIHISTNAWPGYSIDQKTDVLARFEKELKLVLDTLQAPLEILSAYLSSNGLQVEIEEQQQILNSLRCDSYMQSEEAFMASVKRELSKLNYSKLASEISACWREVSGCDDVLSWSESNGIPAIWLYPDKEDVFVTLLQLEKKERVDVGKMELVLNELRTNDFSALKNIEKINLCLLEQLASVACKDILVPHMNELKNYLKTKYHGQVWSYRNNVPTLQHLVQTFITSYLQKDVVTKVETKLRKMNEDQLRKTLQKVLQNNSQLYMQLLGEEEH